MEKYDLAVIGAGQGGLPAAYLASSFGTKVGLIEMKEVGGTCLNEGCIPTKTLLRSAEVMHLIKERALEFGVRGVNPEDISFDLPMTVARKDTVVQGIVNGIHKRLEGDQNIDFIVGQAEMVSPSEIKVNGKSLSADKVILAVGARPVIPDIPGLTETGYITNVEALQLEELPRSMIIIGTGYVGVEFAQMYSRFGTKVTLLGRADRILLGEEPELADMLAELMRAEGIDLHDRTEVISAGVKDGQRYVIAKSGSREERFTADTILLATGRIARVNELGLENTEVRMEGNYMNVNGQLKTTASNTWSIGDANGGPMYTHRAVYDGKRAALNAVKNLGKDVDYRIVPRALFTEPSLASVGLTEEQAKQRGFKVNVGKSYFTSSGRAKAMAQTEGMLKVIVNREDKEILGAHILGEHADIMIHEAVVAMYQRGTIDSLQKSIHIHPTLSEMVQDVAKAAR